MRIEEFRGKLPANYAHCYGVYFNNPAYEYTDVTEFNVSNFADLEDMWADFCYENHLAIDSVVDVEVHDYPVSVSFVLTVEDSLYPSDLRRQLEHNMLDIPGVVSISEVEIYDN